MQPTLHTVSTDVAEETPRIEDAKRSETFHALSPFQQRFVLAWPTADSIADAVRRAGSKARTVQGLSTVGRRLLKYVDVQTAIREEQRIHRRNGKSRWERCLDAIDDALEPEVPVQHRLKAAELNGKIEGRFAPEQHVVKVDPHPVLADAHLDELVKQIDCRVLPEGPSEAQEGTTDFGSGDGTS